VQAFILLLNVYFMHIAQVPDQSEDRSKTFIANVAICIRVLVLLVARICDVRIQ
jgi:hypothetical protein